MQAALQWLDCPKPTEYVVLFAHGAGAGPESEFMQSFAAGFQRFAHVALLTFPYWQQVLATAKRRPPNPAKQLDQVMINASQEVSERFPQLKLILVGKSMGARVAFRCAHAVNASARIALGFPFHAPGKKEKTRLGELAALPIPSLVVQGTRDPFGDQAFVEKARGVEAVLNTFDVMYIEQGNHDLKQPKRVDSARAISWQVMIGNIEKWLERKI